jgi:hypothetical protein
LTNLPELITFRFLENMMLPPICHQMHPEIAAEVDRLDAAVDASFENVARLRLRLTAIKILAANDAELDRMHTGAVS